MRQKVITVLLLIMVSLLGAYGGIRMGIGMGIQMGVKMNVQPAAVEPTVQPIVQTPIQTPVQPPQLSKLSTMIRRDFSDVKHQDISVWLSPDTLNAIRATGPLRSYPGFGDNQLIQGQDWPAPQNQTLESFPGVYPPGYGGIGIDPGSTAESVNPELLALSREPRTHTGLSSPVSAVPEPTSYLTLLLGYVLCRRPTHRHR